MTQVQLFLLLLSLTLIWTYGPRAYRWCTYVPPVPVVPAERLMSYTVAPKPVRKSTKALARTIVMPQVVVPALPAAVTPRHSESDIRAMMKLLGRNDDDTRTQAIDILNRAQKGQPR